MADLLYYFPYKYVDRSRFYAISEIENEMPFLQVKGQIKSYEEVGEGRAHRLVAHFTDGTGWIDLVWFRGTKYVRGRYHENTDYIVFGRPKLFKGTYDIAHPDIEPVDATRPTVGGLRPYYNVTDRMRRSMFSSQALEKMMRQAVDLLAEPLTETLPVSVIAANHLMSLTEALRNIHFPADAGALQRARLRLKFEELFFVQLNILRYARDRRRKYRGYVFGRVGDAFNTFYHQHLPFELTGAQKRVLREIRRDMGSGRQMNRLLQGDVGSGKTLVALMSMLIAIDSDYQACLMAPTEILANQHYKTICGMVEGMDISVELLTGSIRGQRREDILRRLRDGEVNILIGTHAVIEDPVDFKALGLAVIDEQHRFGVAQRARLWQKSDQPPHVLVMTATPIPRTLAMTVYGDLDVSVIDELPPGRKPVHTTHNLEYQRQAVYQFVAKQIAQGRQVYMVYPLIKESEKTDLKNLEDGFEQVCACFPHCMVCKVHGRMKAAQKDTEMGFFVSGEAQIMVATTVIEVGVDVPNATVMVIENAERFGLSQLHQLRGRVGRGADQSYCILMTKTELSADTRKRLDIMVETNDGFRIAEADLKLRGPGDPEGTLQSGIAFDLKIANLASDGQIVQLARTVAEEVLDRDPEGTLPENETMWQRLRSLRKDLVNWGDIS